MTAAATATFLLRLGTLPFLAYIVCIVVDRAGESPEVGGAIRLAIICHAGTILAFIGGLQQACCVAAEIGLETSPADRTGTLGSTAASALVISGILIAIVGCVSVLGAAVRGSTALEPLALAVAYGCQLSMETLALPASLRRPMLVDARRAPMLAAIAALVTCALEAKVELSVLAACAAAVAGVANIFYHLGWRSGSARAGAVPRAEAPFFSAVGVGTTNPCKLRAVRVALAAYGEVAGGVSSASGRSSSNLTSHKVPSDVSEQPMTLEETARGARNRAASAHAAHRAAAPEAAAAPVLGLGIESGLFELKYDGVSRYYDVCVVSAFDGAAHHLGMSCAFEIPPPILRHVLEHGLDLSQACNASLITNDDKIGEHGGLIGLLSSSRITREEYTVQALNTALFFAAAAARPWYSE